MNPVWLDNTSLNHPRGSVRSIMLKVIVALLPGTVTYACLIHTQIILNIVLAIICAVLVESLILLLRQRPAMASINDASIILAAWLLALCLPPTLPHWQLVIGVVTMCTLGKHVFGGLGHNPFNPAMVAYAILIISFPTSMTHWQTDAGFFDTVKSDQTITPSASSPKTSAKTSAGAEPVWDGLTQATALDRLRQIQREKSSSINLADEPDYSSSEQLPHLNANSLIVESDWFPLTVAWLIGGLYLLLTRTISWHIPFSVMLSISILYTAYGFWGYNETPGPAAALFSGAVIFGAFFIATDPVTAASSHCGKLIYGAGIGILCFIIREFSAYPEGFAFAVLLMNICVPLIDYSLTRATGGVLYRPPKDDNK